jgi:heptosyltransferase-1
MTARQVLAPGSAQRILIIKLSSIGDIVHALPVATALRRQFPALRVTWAVEAPHAVLVHRHPAIDRVVTFPPLRWGRVGPEWTRKLRAALRALAEESYDVALDLQGLLKSSFVALASRAPVRLGLPRQREGAALVSRAVPLRDQKRHAVDRYLECAAFLGAATSPVDFALAAEPSSVASLNRILQRKGIENGARLIVINPSASRRWKAWPPAAWAKAADGLADEGRVLLIGGAEHGRRHREVVDRARTAVVDLTGATTLGEAVALLARCAVHVGPDTGTLHIAAALGRPVVGIYGPTLPAELGPYGQLDLALHRPGACGAGCPQWCMHRRRCLRAITPDEVIARVRSALAREEG